MRVVLRWSATDQADALLRRTVAGVHGAQPADVTVTRRCPRCGSGRHGAPLAHLTGHGAVAVSVSRARGLTVVAVADAPALGLGVDVEPAGRPAAGLADVLDRHARPDGEPEDDVLRRWVRVEAVLKAAGVGLTVDPRDVVVVPPDRVAGPADVVAPGWWVLDTAAVPGCVGAVALRLAAPARPRDVTLVAIAG